MKLRKARIKGFQSFADTGEIEFDDGINLIVGQNNSGKSAILRSFLPNLSDDRHRTPGKWSDMELEPPLTTFTIEISGSEIRQWILVSGRAQAFPLSELEYKDYGSAINQLLDKKKIEVIVDRRPNQGFSAGYPSHRLFTQPRNQRQYCATVALTDGNLVIQQFNGTSRDDLPFLLNQAWHDKVYFLAAERMAIGQAAIARVERLTPRANNLPSVLNTLSSERGSIFEKLVSHIREIFPTVGNLTVRTH